MDDNDGVVVNTSEFQTSRPRSSPGRGEYDLLFNVDIFHLLVVAGEKDFDFVI